MNIRKLLLAAGAFLLVPSLSYAGDKDMNSVINEDITFATRQYSLMLDQVGRDGKIRIPKTIVKLGNVGLALGLYSNRNNGIGECH